MPSCAHKIYQNYINEPLLNMLPKTPGRVLDCGCGGGDNARVLTSKGWVVTGITISPEEQRIASAYCEQVYLADLEQGRVSRKTLVEVSRVDKSNIASW